MTKNEPIPKAIRQEAARWLAARETESLAPEDVDRFVAWLAASDVHRRAFAKAEGVWAALDESMIGNSYVAPVPKSRRRGQWHRRSGITQRQGWVGGAFAASLIVTIWAGNIPLRLQADAITATGERHSIRLPDGSTAVLNTDSAIAIDSADGRTIRLLRGEAAFTVAQDRAHPFTVRSRSGVTTALGTQFIVRQMDDGTRVTVTQHSVRVDIASASRMLREGEALTYGAERIDAPRPVAIADADAWMRGRIRVVNRPLREVLSELSRYHSGYIGVLGDALARRPVSGVFDVSDPAGAIDVIQRTLGIRSTRLTDRLILLHD